MKIELETHEIQTKKIKDIIKITAVIEADIKKSGVSKGMVNIISPHTTAGILVNEGVECVQTDIHNILDKLAPEQGDYLHARYLDPWGGSAANAHTHLKNMLAGIHVFFPINDGKMVIGGLQDIYFIEFDGPCLRKFIVQIFGQ